MTAELVKKVTYFGTYFGKFGYLNGFLYWEKYYPDGHQHGVSIQISILNLDDTLLRIARELKTAET